MIRGVAQALAVNKPDWFVKGPFQLIDGIEDHGRDVGGSVDEPARAGLSYASGAAAPRRRATECKRIEG